MAVQYLLSIPEAAAALGVSPHHVRRLVNAAGTRSGRWRFGREIIDLSLGGESTQRTIRINMAAVIPGFQPLA